MSELTVWSVCTGTKYHSGYVYALRDAVAQYLSIPHEFRCITTRSMPGIHTVLPPVPYQGWWSKMGLWYPGISEGPSLYFDLDVAICGSLDYLADFTRHEFAAPSNWAQSGHGGIQSSVMAWRGDWTRPYESIKPRWPAVTSEFWGDQEFLWDLLGDDWARIPRVCSYKYHVRPHRRIPDDASVIVFHGEPKNADVEDACVLPFTARLRSLISGSMENGFNLGSPATA